MSVNINIKRSQIGGNVQFLNNARLKEQNQVRFSMQNSRVNGKMNVLENARLEGQNQVKFSMDNSTVNGEMGFLNDAQLMGKNEIGVSMDNSTINGETNVLNGTELEDSSVNVGIKDTFFREDATFMNNKTFKGKVIDEKISERGKTKNAKEGSLKQTEELSNSGVNLPLQVRQGKMGIISRIKRMFEKLLGKEESTNDFSSTVSTAKQRHEQFEQIISGNGQYREMNQQEIIDRVLSEQRKYEQQEQREEEEAEQEQK